jgi:hypothetical protein
MERLSVWSVIGGCDYEGESEGSLRLFFREEDARVYEQFLLSDGRWVDCGYDYVVVTERVVE